MEYGDPEERKRTPEYDKDALAEEFLKRLNAFLIPLENELLQGCTAPKLPMSFIVGVPRCGSTLMMQLTTRAYDLGYPSNLLARFFMAPSVGAWLQRLIHPVKSGRRGSTVSTYGVTTYPEEPHEFGYFWTGHFRIGSVHELNEREFARVNKVRLLQQLASMERILARPLIFKSLNINFLVRFLFQCIPAPFFLYMRRDPYFLAESIYLARIARYGSADAWWSLRPRCYEELKKLDNHHQVAGQVWTVKRELERQLKDIPERNKIVIDYDRLCADPERALLEFAERISSLGFALKRVGPPLKPLSDHSTVRLDKREAEKLRTALREMESWAAAR